MLHVILAGFNGLFFFPIFVGDDKCERSALRDSIASVCVVGNNLRKYCKLTGKFNKLQTTTGDMFEVPLVRLELRSPMFNTCDTVEAEVAIIDGELSGQMSVLIENQLYRDNSSLKDIITSSTASAASCRSRLESQWETPTSTPRGAKTSGGSS